MAGGRNLVHFPRLVELGVPFAEFHKVVVGYARIRIIRVRFFRTMAATCHSFWLALDDKAELIAAGAFFWIHGETDC